MAGNGLLLAKMLKKRNMTKYQFAKAIGEPYRHVFRFFRPSYDPTLRQLRRFARGLRCRVRDLIQED